MFKISLCVLLLGTLTTVQAVPNTPCSSATDCDPNECCQPNQSVISKRDRIGDFPPTGTCQPLRTNGQFCNPDDTVCGCQPGLVCREFTANNAQIALGDKTSAGRKRDMVGTHKCQPL